MTPIKTVPVAHDTFPLDGGLDQVTPLLALKPGAVRDSVNFELSEMGGYARINGYEICDGHSPLPSEATWRALTMSSVTGVAVGDTISSTIGGVAATAQVIAISGLTLIATLFSTSTAWDGASVYNGATLIGTVAAAGASTFTSTVDQNAVYDSAASQVYHDLYRNSGYQPSGSGPIRGVAYFQNDLYCWRDNGSSTNLRFKKWKWAGAVTTGSLFHSVDLGVETQFQAGSGSAPAVGSYLSQTTVSGTARARVRKVLLESGTWGSGTAAGRFFTDAFDSVGFFLPGALTSGATATLILPTNSISYNVAMSSGGTASVDIASTLKPGGRVQWVLGTFNSSEGQKLYGCDGVNRAFEFDGSVYIPINSGMSNDAPTNVAIHKNYLWLSFGPSIQNSAIGDPYSFSPVLGANEFLVPEDVTALQTLPGTVASGALAVFSDSNTFILYGSGSSTWNLVPFNNGVGAKPYTVQTMDSAYALDDKGVVSMSTTLNFGNFDSATLTFHVREFIKSRRGTATASALNREKNQLRMFFSDGSGLYMTIVNGQYKGAMPVQFPDPVFCWSPGQTINGTEISYVGSSNGWVYRLDSGNSFSGSNISSYLLLSFTFQGNNRVLKRYRKASIEVTGLGYAEYQFGYSLAYASTDISQADKASYTIPFVPFLWDSFTWDSFTWDIQVASPRELTCDGTGENISLAIYSDSNKSKSFKINSATIHYSNRRALR
jgi:hypothetical protein